MQILLIGLYLIAIIAANLLVAVFGPSVAILNAFFFIGLDLTAKDKLQDLWQRGLVWRMGSLIATGSILSWLLNRDAGPIALASFLAFALASVVDATVYQWLRHRAWMVRANGSNLLGAAVDSLIFPLAAFGLPLMWGIVLGQFAAKVLGGLLWSAVLARFRTQPASGWLLGAREVV